MAAAVRRMDPRDLRVRRTERGEDEGRGVAEYMAEYMVENMVMNVRSGP